MRKSALKAGLAILLMAMIAFLISGLAGQGLPTYGGLNLALWSLVIAFGLQWLMFVHAYLCQAERFYDLTGAVSNIAVVVLSLSLSTETARNYLLAS
ncbi:hypothetical protein [Zhongshania borealis]|uniref:Uncharacterized protein n=1 Tax=Zhongshania borealis TaxID=889488 RepID=A0ABP7WXB1_9GAMM